MLDVPVPDWWHVPGDRASTWLSRCLAHSPSAGQALWVPADGHLPISPRTEGHVRTSRPAGPPSLSVQAKCNPCLSSPCQNQGTCNNDPLGFYRCACPSGYKVRWCRGSPVQGDESLQRGRERRGGLCHAPGARCLQDCPPSLHVAVPCQVGWGRDFWARCCGTLLAPTLPLFPGQGLRGGTQRLLLQPLCQWGDLPASGGGRSWVQVSAGQGPTKDGCLGSGVAPRHPMEIKSDASFPSCMLPWARSWDIVFTWQLHPTLPALCSRAQHSTSRAERWLCFPMPPSPAGSWAEAMGGRGGPTTTMGGMGRQRTAGFGAGIRLLQRG